MPDWEEYASTIHTQHTRRDQDDAEELGTFSIYHDGESTQGVSSPHATPEKATLALLSRRTLLVGLVLLLGFLAIFMWSWIFEVLGFFSGRSQVVQTQVKTETSEILTLPGQVSPPERRSTEAVSTPVHTQTLQGEDQAPLREPSLVPATASSPTVPLPISPTTAEATEIRDTSGANVAALPQALQTESSVKPTQQQGSSLLDRNPEHYTIQIIALQDPEKLKILMNNHAALQNNLFTYTIRREGKMLHVLSYGDFDTKQAATTAVVNLPLEIQKNKPWVRLLRDVQGVIREQS